MGMILDGIELPVCCGEGFRIYPYNGDVIITCDGTPKFAGTNIPYHNKCNKSKRLGELKDGILWEDCDYCGGDLYEETKKSTSELPDDVEDLTVCEYCWEKHYTESLGAESKKMNPLEKAGISGVASGATMEGLETLLAAEEGIYEVITQQQVDDEMICEGCPHTFKVGDSYAKDGDLSFCVTCAKDFKTCIDCDEAYDPEGEHKWAKTCSYCEGSGFIMTSYTSATYDDPAEADGDDCEACDALGYVCEEGEGYGAESYSAEELLGGVEVNSNVYNDMSYEPHKYITVSFTDKTGEYEWEGTFYHHNSTHINSNKGLISYDPKTRMAVYDYNGIHWRGQVNFAGKSQHHFSSEELSEEQLRAYFARLKDKNPKLAKEIEISIKDQSYLPPHSVINKAGFDYEIIEAWADLVAEEDKYAPFERCDECEGEGYILTSYTSATRFDPADGDGEDCGECGGTGEIDPADYMYSNHDGRVDYLAETFNAEYDMVKTSFKCKNIQYNRRRSGSLDHRNWYPDVMQPDDTWPSMTVSVEHKGNIEKYTLESLTDVIREKLENEISFHVKKPVDVVFFTSERLEELQKKRLAKEFNNRGRINHQERWWAAETFNTEYDEEDMVHCNHCSDIVGNEKEVYGDETVEYEMANGELVCIPCHKIWMKEYKNDLDPHYSPFYAESFEAAEWVGFCPECNKWRTKEMSVKIDSKINTTGWSIPDKLLGKRLCKKSQRFGKIRQSGDTFTGYGSRGFDDSYCGTPLTKVKSKYKAEAEEKSITPYLLGVGIVGILGYAFTRKLY